MRKNFVVFLDFPQAKAGHALQEWRGPAAGFRSAVRKAMADTMKRDGIKGVHHATVKIVVQVCNGFSNRKGAT